MNHNSWFPWFLSYCPFDHFHTCILSRACLKDCTSYGYEILWVDRSDQGGVQCTWTLTLACLIFELLSFFFFFFFHTWMLYGAYLQDYNSYSYEISWKVTTWGKTGVSCNKMLVLFYFVFGKRKSGLHVIKIWIPAQYFVWPVQRNRPKTLEL